MTKTKNRIHNFVHHDLTIATMDMVLFYDEKLPCFTLLNRVSQIVSKMGQNDPLVKKRLNKSFRDLHSTLVFKI